MFLALKPAAKLAWAAWSPGMERPIGGTMPLPADPTELGLTGMAVHRGLRDLLCVHGFERCFYERPNAPGDIGEKGFAELGRVLAIIAHIESFCAAVTGTSGSRIRCRYVAMAAWQRAFLGKGIGESAKTFDQWTRTRCQELGWRCANREEADARGILDYAVGLDEALAPPWRAQPFESFEMRRAVGR